MKKTKAFKRKIVNFGIIIPIRHKLITCVAAFLCVTSTKLIAQCGTNVSTAAHAAAQPTNCNQILADLVPKTYDRVIEVNVKFHCFQPAANSGVWSSGANATTAADAQHCLDVANAMFANMPAPALPVNGVTSITDAKIKFVLYGFHNIVDPTAYSSVNTAAQSQYYEDKNAINVFMGDVESFNAIYAPAVPGIYPNNWTVFHPQFNNNGNPNWDNIKFYGAVFAHEAGHILGLAHTTTGESSVAYPSYGCCNTIDVQDYTADDGSWNPCLGFPGYPWANGSNNIMSQNTACGYQYLSPHQVALMHYYLRTDLKKLCSTTGFNDATTYHNLFDYTLSANETWATDRYFKGHITIPNGKTLIVKCGLAMANGSKIFVQKGGQLVVDGGKITNISERAWGGIEVLGTETQPAITAHPTSPGALAWQGIARIKNGGTISNSYIGIKNYSGNTLTSGGVIIATDAYFINNRIDVDLWNSNTSYNSYEYFSNCKFQITGPIGDGHGSVRRMNINKTNGVKMYGCQFEYLAGTLYPYPGYGIYSIDGGYRVDKNGSQRSIFRNFERGINSQNSNPIKHITIVNSDFINNRYIGAYIYNQNFLVFENNDVQLPPTSLAAGVYLNTCKYYKIKNNTFTENSSLKLNTGLYLYRSGNGTHEVYRNTFSKLKMAVNCVDDNSGATNVIDGLVINCNDFTPSPNLYDVLLTKSGGANIPSVAKVQGAITNQSWGNLARNKYGALCNNNENRWYVHSSSVKIIHHGTNSDPFTKPLPQPSCGSYNLVVAPSAIQLNYALHCKPNPPSSGGTGTDPGSLKANMNSYLTSLRQTNVNEKNHFEIQSTMSSKINLLLDDTLTGRDSVLNILNQNESHMTDADIQTIFTAMYKGNYALATQKKDMLPASRQDWANLLTKLIEIDQNPEGIFSINSNAATKNFLIGYADDQNKDGHSIAQALLSAACDRPYTIYFTEPEQGGNRLLQQNTGIGDNSDPEINIYPNPASSAINISYTPTNFATAKIELCDLLGNIVYSRTAAENGENYISVNDYTPGMYIVRIIESQKIIRSTKIIIEH